MLSYLSDSLVIFIWGYKTKKFDMSVGCRYGLLHNPHLPQRTTLSLNLSKRPL
jgi:hypothetical protein